jgi:type II secretory pathway component PulJ
MTAAMRRTGQAGLTPMEMLVAAFLGVLLVVCGGYLFRTQVKGYTDIRDQARIQADLKKALQAITRQISNAGACMPDPRKGFSAGHDKLSFSYVDMKTRFCDDENDVLTMTLYSRPGSQEDYLIQEIRCPGKSVETRTLARVPGGVDLAFRYVDKAGAGTADVGKIKAVQLDITLQTKKMPGRPARARTQTLQIDCPNLI